ncbi:MAG TPA: toxin-antitoxin system HicB family antitoxin [Rhodothermales bacterium]|nr:toxin-antitoxin system HicB family antitoxin [Rhodothermales bacterium]
MRPKAVHKHRKTFPLELEDALHKALKHKAIEADKSLHAFIIDALTAKVQEDPVPYSGPNRQAADTVENKE